MCLTLNSKVPRYSKLLKTSKIKAHFFTTLSKELFQFTSVNESPTFQSNYYKTKRTPGSYQEGLLLQMKDPSIKHNAIVLLKLTPSRSREKKKQSFDSRKGKFSLNLHLARARATEG